MPMFRKKPVVIEAIQFNGRNFDDIKGLLRTPLYGRDVTTAHRVVGYKYTIRTLEGNMIVSPGDWVITGVKGEMYPCKPDIFAQTYEPVDAEAEAGVQG